jgi:hypothetical protein
MDFQILYAQYSTNKLGNVKPAFVVPTSIGTVAVDQLTICVNHGTSTLDNAHHATEVFN